MDSTESTAVLRHRPDIGKESYGDGILYYRDVKLDESSRAEVSPSGRYAVYGSDLYRGVLLFDSQDHQIYRVTDVGSGPSVERWGIGEGKFSLKYYLVGGNNSETIEVDVTSLKPIGSLESPPPRPH
jgi:hypothetical protein